MKTKVLALENGGDWADASVSYLVKITDKAAEEMNDEYISEGGYHGTKRQFDSWLKFKGYCREANNDELEIFYPL